MPDPHRTAIDPRTGEGGEGPLLDRFRLDGRVAIITGTSSGLGAGIAAALASAGATVVLAARRRERLESLAEEIRAKGGIASTVSCDVTDHSRAPTWCARR